ncbi:hypothetical protein GCM10025787_49760 [Saccharopolyspora rosea]|uniref:Amidophosphoribosyltransferase n=1 Tax=Saccharopolyspora rosea TaxID=524884 RepID=A0ABW3FUN8_9PSEU
MLKELAHRVGSGFLRNTIRRKRVTCLVCTSPLDLERPFTTCFTCKEAAREARRCDTRTADLVVPLVYAIKGGQSAHLMRTYKTAVGTPAGTEQLTLLLHTGFAFHRVCIESAAEQRLTAWSTVPSTRRPDRVHPMRNIASTVLGDVDGLREVTLLPGPAFAQSPRKFVEGMWRVEGSCHGAHVLLIDDTWTTGANVQSAAAALRAAGAARVTVLVLARWLDPAWSPTQKFMRQLLVADYDITHCPVAGDWSCVN